MLRSILVAVLVVAVVLCGGCSKKKTNVEILPDPVPVQEAKPEPQPEPVELKVVDDNATAYSMPTTIYFDFGQATIRPDQLVTLDGLAKQLGANGSLNITIYGATCPIGTEDYNLHLGQARAAMIQTYLVNAGIDPVRIATVSWGEAQEHIVAEDFEMLWKNRRGECFIERTK